MALISALLGLLAATAAAAPSPASGVWVVPGNGQLTVTWEPGAGNTAYQIYRSTTSGTLGSLLTTVTAPTTSYVDATTTNGTSYYYTVRGYDGVTESADPVSQFVNTAQVLPRSSWIDDCSGVLNGRIYVFGSYKTGTNYSDIQVYDPVANTAGYTGMTVPNTRYWCGADRSNGQIYLFGGGNGTNGATTYNSIYEFDPVTGLTLMNGTLPSTRYQLAAQTMADGKVYAVGGQNAGGLNNAVWAFNPFTDPAGNIPLVATMNYATGIAAPGLSAIDGDAYLTGGGTSSSGISPTTLNKKISVAYGPEVATPSDLLAQRARLGAHVAALNDRVYSIAGADYAADGSTCGLGCTVTNAVNVYDQRANTWSTMAVTAPTTRMRGGAQRIKGFIYIFGGNSGSTLGGTWYPQIYRFDPGGQARGTPGAPRFATAATSLAATPGNKRANLSWTAGSTIDYYRIFRSTSAGVLGSLIEEQSGGEDAPGTSITDAGLVNGTTYYYTVTAVGYDGHETAPTAQVSVTPYAPIDPTNLAQFRSDATTAIPTGSVTLDGTTNDVVLKFDVGHPYAGHTLTPWVELSATGTFSETCGASTAGVTFSGAAVGAPLASTAYPATVAVTGLAVGTTWYWRACTVDELGVEGDWVVRGGAPDFRTNAVPVAVLVTPAAAGWVGTTTPTLTAQHTDGDADTGTLRFETCSNDAADPWSANCGASYQVMNSASGIANTANGFVSPPVALPEGTSYWRARSTDQRAVVGAWTASRSVQVDTTAPTVPSNVSVAASGKGSVTITWSASVDAGVGSVTYDVEFSSDGVSWSAACTGIVPTLCKKTGLGAKVPAVMRVRACDALGNCAFWQGRAGASGTDYNLRSSLASAQLTNAANKQATLTSATDNVNTSITHGTLTGWLPLRPGVTGSTTQMAGEPANTPYTSPTGTGWVIDSTLGATLAAGDISVDLTVNSSSATGTGDIQCRAYRVTTTAGNITTPTFLGKGVVGADVMSGTANTVRTCKAATLASQISLAANEVIYVEIWLNVTVPGAAGASIAVHVEAAQSTISIPSQGTSPDVPVMVAPADLASTTTTPSLQATYTHPTPTNGFAEFELATSSGFGGTIVQTGTSALLATTQTGSLATGPLTGGVTYYWRVRGVDINGISSAWSATRSFTVGAAVTLSIVVDQPAVDLGMQSTNTDDFGTFTVTVTTNNGSGYQLTAIGSTTGTAGADCGGCAVPFADWSGTGATPTPWTANTGGFMGITVRDALGGRMGKWGAGTATAESSTTLNNYAGLLASSSLVLHDRPTAAAGGDPVVVTWRADPAGTTSAGVHTETVTMTAVANP